MCLPFASFCCCISLEVGAQVISVVSVLFSTFLTALYGTASAVPLPMARAGAYALLAAGAGLQALAGGLLAYGAFAKKPRWMKPWLVLAWLSSAALLVLSVAGTCALLAGGGGGGADDAQTSAVISAFFVYAVVEYYFACVVDSRRRELVRGEDATESAHSLMGGKLV